MNKNNQYYDWQKDISPEEKWTFWEIISAICITVALLVMFWVCAAVGNAYEEHHLCLNGATEYCIPEDFQ